MFFMIISRLDQVVQLYTLIVLYFSYSKSMSTVLIVL
jgi:hypothetical protein